MLSPAPLTPARHSASLLQQRWPEPGSNVKETRLIMGMPVTVYAEDTDDAHILELVFSYFMHVDEVFSTYKDGSEISRINRDELQFKQYSPEMIEVFRLSEETREATGGFFNIQT